MSMNVNRSSHLTSTLRYVAILISLLVWFVMTGCPLTRMSAECREFFSLAASQREKLFSTYDLEKQLDLYRCGMHRRPPATSLSLLIAEKGESAVPLLLEKLERERDEQFELALTDVFAVMSIKGYLRDRKDVASRIRQVVERMKVSTFRERAQENLEQIERNSS